MVAEHRMKKHRVSIELDNLRIGSKLKTIFLHCWKLLFPYVCVCLVLRCPVKFPACFFFLYIFGELRVWPVGGKMILPNVGSGF